MPSSSDSSSSTATTSTSERAATSASPKAPTRTSKRILNSPLRVVHRFDDGTQYVLPLEDQVFEVLGSYARMYVSEDPVQRETGIKKLRQVAKLIAKTESDSFFGKILNGKKQEKLDHKNDEIQRFFQEQDIRTATKIIASRLRKRFEIKSDRAAEDRVREWKKSLRSARAA